MIKITLSNAVYSLLMLIIEQALRQANNEFMCAPLNSPEESAASVRMSVLMDIQASLITQAQMQSTPDEFDNLINNN